MTRILGFTPFISINSIPTIFPTLIGHSSGIFSKQPLPFQTPPSVPNTPSPYLIHMSNITI